MKMKPLLINMTSRKAIIVPTKPTGELFHLILTLFQTTGWKKLGLRDKTIQTILNYLRKGGQFQKPETCKESMVT